MMSSQKSDWFSMESMKTTANGSILTKPLKADPFQAPPTQIKTSLLATAARENHLRRISWTSTTQNNSSFSRSDAWLVEKNTADNVEKEIKHRKLFGFLKFFIASCFCGLLLGSIALTVVLVYWLKSASTTTITTTIITTTATSTTSTTTSTTSSTTTTTTTSVTTTTTTTSVTTTTTTTSVTTTATTTSVSSTTSISTISSSTTTSTTSSTSATNSLTSVTTVTTSITSTTTTTTVTCDTGYTQTPSGSCVNLLIDFNNCGSIGYVCPSNYTSCSGGVCSIAPPVRLSNPIPIPGWGGSLTIDDASYVINFPFSVRLYGYSSSTLTVTTNGVVCLSACSTAYTNGILPDGNFAGPTAFAYWDDLMIYSGTSQNVYYAVTGTAPNRAITFEYYLSHISLPNEYYQFQICFYENQPDIVEYIYYESTDTGASATVGVQASTSGPSMTYSVDQVGSVTQGMTLRFDTNAGTFSG